MTRYTDTEVQLDTALGQIRLLRGSHVGAFRVLHNGSEVAEVEQAIVEGKRKWIIADGKLIGQSFETREDAAKRFIILNDDFVK